MALAPVPFLIAAWHTFFKDQKVQNSKKTLAVLGLLLAIYCTIPGICFALDGLVRKHYSNRPIVPPTLVDQLFLPMTILEFMCFIFVPVAAISSIVFLVAVRGKTLRYGAIAVCMAWAMLWFAVFLRENLTTYSSSHRQQHRE
jgi:hypothetical protein